MSRETSLLSPSLILRPRWVGPLVVRASDLDLIQELLAGQSGTPSCATKRRSDLLLHMPCHLSEIQGLRWPGGSLEERMSRHREIS